MSSFLGQQVQLKAVKVSRKAETKTVAATKPKAAKKVASTASKNKWTGSSSGCALELRLRAVRVLTGAPGFSATTAASGTARTASCTCPAACWSPRRCRTTWTARWRASACPGVCARHRGRAACQAVALVHTDSRLASRAHSRRTSAARSADAAPAAAACCSYGYDPLGLGQTPEQVEKYREYELIHARWAMLGAFGAILPEALDSFGANIPGAVWWQVRSAPASISS